MRKLKTAIWLLQNRGIKNTFLYSVRKIFFFLSQKERNEFIDDTSLQSANIGDAVLHFHPSKKGVSEVVGIYGVHEPITTEIYLNSIKVGESIIEIGANIGYYTLHALNSVGETGKVLGFEPVPDNVKVLKKNIAPYDNVQIFNSVVSNKIGEVDFYISEIPNWGTLINSGESHIKNKLSIPSVTLDDTVSNLENFKPDMIHMDIEGGEIVAFNGAWETIATFKPKIFVEFHPFATGYDPVTNILNKLQELGYSKCTYFDRTLDEPWIPRWIRQLSINESTIPELISIIEHGRASHCFTFLAEKP